MSGSRKSSVKQNAALDLADLDLDKLTPEELEELDLLLAAEHRDGLETSLAEFAKEAWKVLQPGRELVWSWHYDFLCEYLTLVRDRKIRRLIINVPPRTLKSLLVTVIFPVWVWATSPEHRFLCASYSQGLSTEHSVFRRNLIRSDWFRQNFHGAFELAGDQNLKTQYDNTSTGQMIATSVGGTATGKGGDTLIVDDPLNPQQAASDTERKSANDWFDNTLRSRLNDQATGAIVVVMQRLHELDLTGHLEKEEPGEWTVIRIPLIAEGVKQKDGTIIPEVFKYPISGVVHERHVGDVLQPQRFTGEVVRSLKIRAMVFAGQYQQRPAPAEGNIIKAAWIRRYGGDHSRPLPEKFDRCLISVDCSFKDPEQSKSGEVDNVAIYTVGVAGPDRYALDLDLRPMGQPETETAVLQARAKARSWHKAGNIEVLVEDKANGPAVIRALKKKIPGVIAVDPQGGKIARGHAASSSWESGNWFLPEDDDQKNPWTRGHVHSLISFPNAAHDDDFDAMTQAEIRLQRGGLGGLMEFIDRSMAKANEESKVNEAAEVERLGSVERSTLDIK